MPAAMTDQASKTNERAELPGSSDAHTDTTRAPDAPLSPVWGEGKGPLALLPARLFRDRSPLPYVLLAWALSLAGSLALGAVLAAIAPDVETPDLAGAPAWAILLGIVILSPLLETLIMGSVLLVLMRLLKPWQAVLASAALWGVGHSLMTPTWGLVIWWPFTLFSLAFVTWRARGFWRAVAVVSAIHMLQNLLPALAIVFPEAIALG